VVEPARLHAYTVRASVPDVNASSSWDMVWDATAGVYGADLPIARLRLTNRLSQTSELEFEMPRTDSRGFPVLIGNYYTQGAATLAPMFTIITVYRFGVALFSGPVVAYRGAAGSDSITVQCKDFTHLFEKALISTTYATSSADIFTIVNALHSAWYGRSTGNGYAALQHVLDLRRYTSVGSGYSSTLGKSVAFRLQQYENVMLSDAIAQLSMIGGNGFQFQWWVEYVTNANIPPQPRVVMVSPYAYYYPNPELANYQLDAGQGTIRTLHSADWVVDASQLANEYVVAGYGQGTSQQRAVYRGPGTTHPAERAPLQAFIESDQSVRRNDQAVNRATAGWKRTSYPIVTLRVSWTASEYGGALPFNVVRPGTRLKPTVRDSFLQPLLQANKEMEVASWSIEVDAGDEVCSADFFVPDY
jgi:hypothetical protein